jgi:hypothetical protein
MLSQLSPTPLIDELAPNDDAQPQLVSGSPARWGDSPGVLGTSSGAPSDIERHVPLPAVVARPSIPHRAAKALPVGILLYLLSLGIVASGTASVFLGVGFFLLAKATQAMNASAGAGEEVSENTHLSPALNIPSSGYGGIVSVPIEAQISTSAAVAALPVGPVAPPAGQRALIEDGSPRDAQDRSFGDGFPASWARKNASPATALTAEAVPDSSPEPSAFERVPHLSTGQIAELLVRGDSFLRAGDVASARLFYERAADAGDWQAAMRMGATFDPSFLGRAGARTAGDLAKAQSWYRHALDLGAPRTDRPIGSPKTK